MSSSHVGKDRESLMTELRGFKAEREEEIDTRKKIDQELKGVNSLVQQKVSLMMFIILKCLFAWGI